MTVIVATEKNFNVRTGESQLTYTDATGLRKTQRVRYIECQHSISKHPFINTNVVGYPTIQINLAQYMQRFDIKSIQYMRAIFNVKVPLNLDIPIFTDNDYTFLPNNTLIGTSLISYDGIIKLIRQPTPTAQAFVENILLRFYDTRLSDIRIPLTDINTLTSIYNLI